MRLATVRCLIFSVLLLLCLPVQAIALPEGTTPEQAYKQGTLLYQQNKYTQARPYLDFATDNGYPAAALMMADTYWTNLFIQTEKEADYLLKAAEMDSVIGMVRLGSHRSLSSDSEVWRGLIFGEVEALAKEGNAYAMNLMFALVKDRDRAFDWLIEAAEAGHPPSQHGLAIRYRDGKGFFIWPGSRDQKVDKLFMESAKSGYRPAMLSYAYHLKDKGDQEGFQRKMDELIELGDAKAILHLSILSQDAQDYGKAVYLSKVYIESIGSEGRENSLDLAQSVYEESIPKLSEDQVSIAHKKANEFLRTHTVHYQKRIKEYEYTLESIKKLN